MAFIFTFNMMQRSLNPFNQELLGEFELLRPYQLQAKIAQSVFAYKDWKSTTFQHRSDLMKKASSLLLKNKESLARTISLEMGKVLHESRAEITKCSDACLFYAENAEQFLRDESVETEAAKSFVTYQPTGTILAIMPWNFPFWQVFRFAVPALMAGNVGLLKHSSNVPQCSLLIEKLFRDAGFPDGTFQSLIISNDMVEDILSHDAVHGVALTGSEKAGASVAAIAGKHLRKSVLELGGSDPFIVLADADLDKTIKIAVQSRMQNAGQSCIAAKRFIVSTQIRDEFIVRFRSEIENLRQGDQLRDQTTTGPMARVDLAEELEQQMKRTIQSGGRVICGGDRQGANFRPALIDNVMPGMTSFDEETFGPLAAVTYANSEEDAVNLANMSRYGLGASIWTKDIGKGEALARRLETGTVYVNSLMRSDARLPFGGIKKSGYGRELARHGIMEFVNVKSISVNR
jgi:succinate-semialdehyde dehydrogenase / glutarate-semialdehyde dehydrogenase